LYPTVFPKFAHKGSCVETVSEQLHLYLPPTLCLPGWHEQPVHLSRGKTMFPRQRERDKKKIKNQRSNHTLVLCLKWYGVIQGTSCLQCLACCY